MKGIFKIHHSLSHGPNVNLVVSDMKYMKSPRSIRKCGYHLYFVFVTDLNGFYSQGNPVYQQTLKENSCPNVYCIVHFPMIIYLSPACTEHLQNIFLLKAYSCQAKAKRIKQQSKKIKV